MSAHPYRTHTCGELRAAHAGATVRLAGWMHRKRDHGHLVFVDLRDHYGLTQCVVDASSPVFETVQALRPETVVTVAGEVVRRAPDAVNPKLADRRGRRWRFAELDGAFRRRCPAVPGGGGDRVPRGDSGSATASSTSGARGSTRTSCSASQVDREHPPAHDRRRLHRVPDADPHVELAGGRARLPRAEPRAPGQVLRAPAGAAAVQAAADGRGLRPLLPDRAVLPRRGRARRPLAGRVLPARLRDVVRHAGGRVRRRSSRCSTACSTSSRAAVPSRRRRSRASRSPRR